jgi:hypothetical protein
LRNNREGRANAHDERGNSCDETLNLHGCYESSWKSDRLVFDGTKSKLILLKIRIGLVRRDREKALHGKFAPFYNLSCPKLEPSSLKKN